MKGLAGAQRASWHVSERFYLGKRMLDLRFAKSAKTRGTLLSLTRMKY
jgi:hypothetical protein